MNNAHVKAEAINSIYDKKQLYVTIETPKGKAIISVGEKTFNKVTQLLHETIDEDKKIKTAGLKTTPSI